MKMKNKLKFALIASALIGLYACKTTQPPQKKPVQVGYLKTDISQAELNNMANYKKYYYACENTATGSSSYLVTYFPLSRESRMKDNFGFYFQLDGGKVEPFDHLENRELNARGSRFEVLYRSYHPIQGSFIDLVARERSSIYYKNYQGVRVPWLECREG